ncbi:FAD-dependent monooxygenase [Streptomyces sp. UNOC14_S4]|uniref:FAD-dependent monooxygenase n=1 Tax=Streptomyces sp. UNOC14_S4 TaxID=2872340 RepID=UPI001E6094CC|nr:FAD-dependent monooxygenase [Streptomyces sp. UNOC14_S4]MCC3769590.1 FAD-dependent monooxygenase [Streptomyces sp. UNOC14_S4]
MSTPAYDVAVVGAGPAGCAAALAHARLGRRVLLLEASRTPPARLAGEWLHPRGVDVLRRLGADLPTARATSARGFVLHPEDGDPPIALPCPDGGLAAVVPHADLVTALRATAANRPGITLLLGARVGSVESTTLTWTEDDGPRRRARVRRVVGADGQNSAVRRVLRPAPAPATTVSRTAGILLHGVALPLEGYGHVFAGGPGPALAYRLDPDTVRLTLDVPLLPLRAAALLAFLDHAYAPFLPGELAAAFRDVLARGRIRWAANRLRPRGFHGRGPYALVGDAVGICHPLIASGLTFALRDAECLAHSDDVTGHGRRRQAAGRANEHLAAAMHRMFCDPGRATAELRRSMYAVLRDSAFERERMMRVLCAEEHSTAALAGAVAHVAARALGERLTAHGGRAGWHAPARGCTDYAAWLWWICRGPVHPFRLPSAPTACRLVRHDAP